MKKKYPKTKVKSTVLQPGWLDDPNITNGILYYIGEERLVEWLIYKINLNIERTNEDIKFISSSEYNTKSNPYYSKQELKLDLNNSKKELKIEKVKLKKLKECLKLIK